MALLFCLGLPCFLDEKVFAVPGCRLAGRSLPSAQTGIDLRGPGGLLLPTLLYCEFFPIRLMENWSFPSFLIGFMGLLRKFFPSCAPARKFLPLGAGTLVLDAGPFLPFRTK